MTPSTLRFILLWQIFVLTYFFSLIVLSVALPCTYHLWNNWEFQTHQMAILIRIIKGDASFFWITPTTRLFTIYQYFGLKFVRKKAHVVKLKKFNPGSSKILRDLSERNIKKNKEHLQLTKAFFIFGSKILKELVNLRTGQGSRHIHENL